MKACFKCGLEKPLSEFYTHPAMEDGYLGKCKECTKQDVRHNRRKRLDYYRAYDRARGNRQGIDYMRKKRKENPAQYKAQTTLNNALRGGRLQKPDACWHCGSTENIVGHHVSYDLPLDVIWLCQGCHVQLHKEHELRIAS